MKVFVTGGSGFVGSAVIKELIRAGHEVLGLARSEKNVETLIKLGAKIHHGSLQDLESLKRGASESDGVVHCAFSHDFENFAKNSEDEKAAIEAIGSALVGTQKPLVVTSGVALVSPGKIVNEDSVRTSDSAFPRDPETIAFKFVEKGVRAMAIRLSPVTHDEGHGGFADILLKFAQEKGESAYIGQGLNRWPAVNRLDAAVLYRLALEKGVVGRLYHAVAEEGLSFKEIAEAIGKKLNVPNVSKTTSQAADHFGWFAAFSMIDAPASSHKTQELLGWKPLHIGLIVDLQRS
jgi:nucleoside-diphosphate-sugar epimerase